MDIKEKYKDILEATAETAAPLVLELIFDGAIGTVAPGVVTVMLAYKQKRQEAMLVKFMEETKVKLLEIEENLRKLSTESYKIFKEKYFGMIMDYAIDEVQEEKIQLIINGYMKVAGIETPSEDFVLLYYDTLAGLRLLDINILIAYYNGVTMASEPLTVKHGINNDQLRMLQGKLVRSGLMNAGSGGSYVISQFGRDFIEFFVK